MEIKDLVNLLLERGYDQRSAELVAPELLQLSTSLQSLFKDWVNDASCMVDYSVEGYSILSLMKERKMTYPAALLTIDWLIKEPEAALKSLTKGIR